MDDYNKTLYYNSRLTIFKSFLGLNFVNSFLVECLIIVIEKNNLIKSHACAIKWFSV